MITFGSTLYRRSIIRKAQRETHFRSIGNEAYIPDIPAPEPVPEQPGVQEAQRVINEAMVQVHGVHQVGAQAARYADVQRQAQNAPQRHQRDQMRYQMWGLRV